jgi:hypothetical protein
VQEGLGAHYETRLRELGKLQAVQQARSDAFSSRRGFTMLIALGLLITNLVVGWPVWGVIALSIVGAVFVGLVVAHAFVLSDKALIEDRAAWIRAGQSRMAGRDDERAPSKRNPDPFGKRFEKADHENASDLDLFGEHSLFRGLSRAETSVGEETLASYLLRAAPAAEVRLRQDAAKELLLTPVFLEDLAVYARRAESRGRAEEPLAVWGEAPAELPLPGVENGAPASRATLILAARVLVPLTLVLFFAKNYLGGIAPLLRHAYLVSFVAQLAILGGLYGGIDRMVTFVSSRESPLGRFRKVFELIERQQQLESPLLCRVVKTLTSGGQEGGVPASVEIARLERIVGFADLRHNAIVHMIVNAVFLYDVWVALALERWRHRAGKRTRKWLAAVGECEALASIATYAGENPDFAWPEVDDGAPALRADDLGHPLIAKDKRVANGAALTQSGESALLITGSNMSGKSTYLRSIGLCAVMAGAGLPVCAKSAKVSTMKTWTSMRIGDALDRGMSHFYAELVRLKAIVASAQGGDRVLFLLDEILHGTNSHERSIGARGVVLDLVQRGAVGAVSTHDFALVSISEESSGRVTKVHFSDRIEDGKMVFDYRLKPGVVESTNAIRLMKHLGIDVEYQLAPAERPS